MFWSTLLENTVMAGGLAAVVAVLCRFNRARPALCHMLWLLVFAVLVMPPLPIGGAGLRSSVSSLLTPSVESADPIYVAPAWGGNTLGATWDFEDSAAVSSVADEAWVSSAEFASLEPVFAPVPWYSTVSNKTWFLGSWALGALAILAWMQRRITRFHRGVRAATSAPRDLVDEVEAVAKRLGVNAPEVRMLEGVGSPSVWCFGRARLLWPTQNGVMAERALAPSLIAHELAHIARRDTWVSRLEVLAIAACWWHPLFWLVRRQVHAYAELSCDAWALWAYPKQRLVFAEALIGAHDDTLTAPVALQGLCATNSDYKDFERRLKMILNEKVTRGVSKSAAALAIATTVMILPGESQEPDMWSYGEVAEQCESCEAGDDHTCVDTKVDLQVLAAEAEAIFQGGDQPGAMDAFEAVLSADPDHNGAHARIAYIQIGMRMLDEARPHLQHAIDNGSDVQIAAYNMACCDALEGKVDSGMQHLAKAIRNGFADEGLLATDTDLDALRGAKSFEAAASLVKIANKLREDLAVEGKVEKDLQLTQLRSLYRIVSEDGGLAAKYAAAVHDSGDYKSSLGAFERQAALGHKVPTALYNKGCALAQLGKTEAAMASLFEAANSGMSYPMAKADGDLVSLHSHPRWAEVVEALSAQQMFMSDVEGALEVGEFEKATAMLSNLADSRDADAKSRGWANLKRAEVLMEMADFQAALQSFEAAAALDVAVSESAFGMASAHAAMGHKDEATSKLKAALALGYEDKQRVQYLMDRLQLEPAPGLDSRERLKEEKLRYLEEQERHQVELKAKKGSAYRELVVAEGEVAELVRSGRIVDRSQVGRVAEQAVIAYEQALASGEIGEHVRMLELELDASEEFAEHYRLAIQGIAGKEQAGLVLGESGEYQLEFTDGDQEVRVVWLSTDGEAAAIDSVLLGDMKASANDARVHAEGARLLAEEARLLVLDIPSRVHDGERLDREPGLEARVVKQALEPKAAKALHDHLDPFEVHGHLELKEPSEPKGPREVREPKAPKAALEASDLRRPKKAPAPEPKAQAKGGASDLKAALEKRRLEMHKLEIELEIRRVELETLERKLELEQLERELKKIQEVAKDQAPKPTKKAS